MFAQDFLKDSLFTLTESIRWYQWFYDPERKLLLLLPEFNPANISAKFLWLKILKSCQLNDWFDVFEKSNKNKIICNKMIFNRTGINHLIEHFAPKFLWIVGDTKLKENLNKNSDVHLIFTEDYSKWETQPLIKKQIWLNWLTIN